MILNLFYFVAEKPDYFLFLFFKFPCIKYVYIESKVYLFNLKYKGSIAVLINHRTKSISLLSMGAPLAQLVECLTLDGRGFETHQGCRVVSLCKPLLSSLLITGSTQENAPT